MIYITSPTTLRRSQLNEWMSGSDHYAVEEIGGTPVNMANGQRGFSFLISGGSFSDRSVALVPEL